MQDQTTPRRSTPRRWPAPTIEQPSIEELLDTLALDDSVCEATDGCQVEPDGVCPHGHPSWLRYYGLI